MAEEKKVEFSKSRFLKFEEVKELLNDYMQIKLQKLEVNTAFTGKIIGEVERKELDDNRIVNTLLVEYEDKSLQAPVTIKVQAGANAVKRLEEKNPDKSYIGKYAVFSKTSYQGKFPQFINTMDKKPEGIVSKDEVFASAIKKEEVKPEEQKVIEENAFEEFKDRYNAAIKDKQPDKYLTMLGSFIATYHKEKYLDLIKLCKEASQ